jgi:hypothetical protein
LPAHISRFAFWSPALLQPKITERLLRAAPEEQSIQQQQDHGADD